MPAAKLILDFDSRKFFDASGAVVLSMTGKKTSIREYELTIQQNGKAMSLPADTEVTVAMKKTTAPAGSLLTSVEADRSGWGTGTRWYFLLDLSADAFASATGTTVDFDVMIIFADGQQIMSVTVPFKIEKNVQIPPP